MGHGDMRAMRIYIDGRDRDKYGQQEIHEDPELSGQQEPVDQVVSGLGFRFQEPAPCPDHLGKYDQFRHANDISEIAHPFCRRYYVNMMRPAKHQISKAQEIQKKGHPGSSITGLGTNPIHHVDRRTINQHVPGANQGAIGLPLHHEVTNHILSEIRDQPGIHFQEGKQKKDDAGSPHPKEYGPALETIPAAQSTKKVVQEKNP